MYLVASIFAIAQCTPREKIWNPLMTTGQCINTSAAYLSTAIFNVVTDFAILILPMQPLWKLQMPVKKKVLTTATFATGFLYVSIDTLPRHPIDFLSPPPQHQPHPWAILC